MDRLTICECFLRVCDKSTMLIPTLLRISLIIAIIYDASILDHKSPRAMPFLLALPAFVVMNNTSCHVYRSVRLGSYRNTPSHTSAMNRAIFHPALPAGRQRLEVEVAYNVESDGMDFRPGRTGMAVDTHGSVGYTGVDVIRLRNLEGLESK